MFVFGSSLSLVEARGLKRNASEVDCDPLLEQSEDELASTDVELCEDTLVDLDPFGADRQTNYMSCCVSIVRDVFSHV